MVKGFAFAAATTGRKEIQNDCQMHAQRGGAGLAAGGSVGCSAVSVTAEAAALSVTALQYLGRVLLPPQIILQYQLRKHKLAVLHLNIIQAQLFASTTRAHIYLCVWHRLCRPQLTAVMNRETPHLGLVAFSHDPRFCSITFLAQDKPDAKCTLCKYTYNVPGNHSLPGINAPGGSTSEDCCKKLGIFRISSSCYITFDQISSKIKGSS